MARQLQTNFLSASLWRLFFLGFPHRSWLPPEHPAKLCWLCGCAGWFELLETVSFVVFQLTVEDKFLYLGVTDGPDHFAVLLHLGKVSLNLLFTSVVVPLLGRLGESLLLCTIPVQTKLRSDSSWGNPQERRSRAQSSSSPSRAGAHERSYKTTYAQQSWQTGGAKKKTALFSYETDWLA